MQFKKTKNKKRNLFFRFAIVAFIVWMLWSIVSLQLDLSQKRREYAQMQNQLEEMRIANLELKDMLAHSQDESYIVKMAREHLGFVFPDEIAFVDYSGK